MYRYAKAIIVIQLVSGIVQLLAHTDRCLAASSAYTIPRHIEYSFTLKNTTNDVAEHVELWTYAPVALTSSQQRLQLGASEPFQEYNDDRHNTVVHFTVPHLAPYSTKIITIRADLLLAETPSSSPFEEPDEYLIPEIYCESDDPDINTLANRLSVGNSLETVRAIFQWVAEHVEYTGYLKQPLGAKYALEHKQGDCTEFMYLFVALCRAAGIPARGVGGYVTDKNAILKAAEYHNWAEFYLDGIWHIADPQEQVFMEKQSRYLVMHIIGDMPEDHPMQQYQRFRYLGEGLNVQMN